MSSYQRINNSLNSVSNSDQPGIELSNIILNNNTSLISNLTDEATQRLLNPMDHDDHSFHENTQTLDSYRLTQLEGSSDNRLLDQQQRQERQQDQEQQQQQQQSHTQNDTGEPSNGGFNIPNHTILQRARNNVVYTVMNAPLLRFFNRDNRYNSLNPPGPPINNSNRPSMGWGLDGVFSNLSAKPSVHHEDPTTSTALPTYEEAANDPTPPYWEATIMAGYEDEIFVDGLPVGNIINFIWNMMVSISFQFVGFVITYLLHTSHAAKNGSQAGLGVTLISFGYYTIPVSFDDDAGNGEEKLEPFNPNSIDVSTGKTLDGSIDGYSSSLPSLGGVDTDAVSSTGHNSGSDSSLANNPIFAYGLLAVGIFIVIKAFIDYFKAKRAERAILNPVSVQSEPTPEN